MKLPYNETYCFCLENINDVKLFDEYISHNLVLHLWNPLDYIVKKGIPLPRFVHIIQTDAPNTVRWNDGPDIPDGKIIIPIDAIFNAEKYPELLI